MSIFSVPRTYRIPVGLIPALLVVLAAPTAAQETTFLQDLVDVPLMPGFVEVRDDALYFDKAEGRIAATGALGPASPAEARAFYDTVLPQLGWRPGSGGAFVREGERLEIEIVQVSSLETRLRFSLAPWSGQG